MACEDCGATYADCLTRDRVRVCESCLYERTARERDELRAEVERQKRDIRVLQASNDAKLEQWRRAERDLADAHALLRECHRELATIEAITVSPSDTDGLLNLVRRVCAALEAK